MGQLRTANRRHRRASRQQAARLLATPTPAFLAVPVRAGRDAANDADPVELVASAAIPGGGTLRLLRCGGEFSIQFGSDELMGSCDHVSEEALATITRDRLADGDGRILIGGLGMGFTLRAAQAAWSPAARIVVAELVPEIVEWAAGPLAHLFGDCLADPRVEIAVADVHDLIARAPGAFDAILLDVDNGPDGFMRPENDRIYCAWGLASAYAGLRAGGVLAIWSAYRDETFLPRLEKAGFAVEEARVPAFAGSVDERHSIWFATKPPGGEVARSSSSRAPAI